MLLCSHIHFSEVTMYLGSTRVLALLCSAAILGVVAGMGCSRAPRPESEPGRRTLSADSLRAAYLAEVLKILREVPTPLDPSEAAQLRQRLQEALDTYFPPETFSDIPAPPVKLAGSAPFPGLPLDLVFLGSQEEKTTLAVLERDSIAVLSRIRGRWQRVTWPLPDLPRREVRPIWPAGRLGAADLDGDGVQEIFARHSDFEGLLLWRWRPKSGTLEPARRLQVTSDQDALAEWDLGNYVPGRPFFAVKDGPVRFAYDAIGSENRRVILDTLGGLWLVDSMGGILDSLVGCFGTRLSSVSHSQFLTFHPHSSDLLAFEITGDKIKLRAYASIVGKSPAAGARGTDGVWLSIAKGPRTYGIELLTLVNFVPAFPRRLAGLPVFGGTLEICLADSVDLAIPMGLWDSRLEGLRETFYPGLRLQSGGRDPVASFAELAGSGVEVRLRPENRFADGSALTAAALKSGWEWLARSPAGKRDRWWWLSVEGATEFMAGRASGITGIEVADSLTLRFRGLNRRQVEALLRRPSLAAVKPDPEGDWPIGIGAFQPVEASAAELIAIANPYHPAGRPVLDTLRLVVSRRSHMDLVLDPGCPGVLGEDRQALETILRARLRVRTFRGRQREYVAVLGGQEPPLDRAEVRAAILAVIEPKLLSDLVVTSVSEPVTELLHAELPSPPASDGTPRMRSPIEVWYRSGDRTAREIAERVTARLGALGVPAVLRGPHRASGTTTMDASRWLLIDFLPRPDFPSERPGILYSFLRRYPTEFESQIRVLESTSPFDTGSDSLAVQMVRELVREARWRPIVAVSPFLSLRRDVGSTGPVFRGWPDLATTFWTRTCSLPSAAP